MNALDEQGMDVYERVPGDAMAADATLFAGEDYVEEAWRIVDPLLKQDTPVYSYQPNTWGPQEAERISPARGSPTLDPASRRSGRGGRVQATKKHPRD